MFLRKKYSVILTNWHVTKFQTYNLTATVMYLSDFSTYQVTNNVSNQLRQKITTVVWWLHIICIITLFLVCKEFSNIGEKITVIHLVTPTLKTMKRKLFMWNVPPGDSTSHGTVTNIWEKKHEQICYDSCTQTSSWNHIPFPELQTPGAGTAAPTNDAPKGCPTKKKCSKEVLVFTLWSMIWYREEKPLTITDDPRNRQTRR